MRSGELWFDNSDTRSLDEKIVRAAQYYATKHDEAPDLCYVNPTLLLDKTFVHFNYQVSCRMEYTPQNTVVLKMWEDGDVLDDNMEEWIIDIKPTNSVLVNHFWLGINKKEIA